MAALCNLKTEGINVKLVAIAKTYNVAWWILEDTGHLFPQLNSWQHSGQSHQACKTFISDDELSKSTTHQISTIIRTLVATEGNGNNCHYIPYLHCATLPTLPKILSILSPVTTWVVPQHPLIWWTVSLFIVWWLLYCIAKQAVIYAVINSSRSSLYFLVCQFKSPLLWKWWLTPRISKSQLLSHNFHSFTFIVAH